MITSGTSLRLKDLTHDPRSVGFPPEHPPMRMLLGVPVVYKEQIVGHLYLTEKQGADEFSTEDEEMVRLFAAQAAISIETARLLERSQDLAILEERDRIGMDLHDGAIQALYGIGLNLEDCASLVAAEPDVVASRLDKAINDLNQVIKDIRSYIFHLRPAAYGAGTLTDALLDLAQEIRVNSLIDVEIDVERCRRIAAAARPGGEPLSRRPGGARQRIEALSGHPRMGTAATRTATRSRSPCATTAAASIRRHRQASGIAGWETSPTARAPWAASFN